MESGYRTLEVQLGKGIIRRVRLSKNPLVQGWSQASKELQSPPGAQHQQSQTQVSISIKFFWPFKGHLGSLSPNKGTQRGDRVTLQGWLGQHHCEAFGGAWLSAPGLRWGCGNLCETWGTKEIHPGLFAAEDSHQSAADSLHRVMYLVHPPQDLAKSMPWEGLAGLAFTTSTSLGLKLG